MSASAYANIYEQQIASLKTQLKGLNANSTKAVAINRQIATYQAILAQQQAAAAPASTPTSPSAPTLLSPSTAPTAPAALPPGIKVVGTQPVDTTKYNIPTVTNPTYSTVNSNTGAPPVISSDPNQNPVYVPPSAPQTVTSNSGGLSLGPDHPDEAKLLAEAELQKNLSSRTLTDQNAQRKQHLSDLADLLAKQDATAFDQARPDIYEDLNSRGLLRSSELGSRLATKQQELSKATNYALAQQALSDSASSTNALGGIEDQYLSARNGAIGRTFSLEDYNRQIAASKELGIAMQPMTPTQPSAKGGSALQGAVGGGTIGATVGGPPGAVAGTLLGAIAGGKLGSK